MTDQNSHHKGWKPSPSIEVMEAYAISGVEPTNFKQALEGYNASLDDEEVRVFRGGACLLCEFEETYYDYLTGRQAAQKLRRQHQQAQPSCRGQFVSYCGDSIEEGDDGDGGEDRTEDL